MQEIWKDIKDYEGLYQISNKGRVKSKRKILKAINGIYLKVGLSKNGIQKTTYIHRLVADTFINNKNNYKCINHKDENKHNNSVENLEWCTNLYNINYGKRNEKVSKNQSKYKIIQKDKNNNIIKIWDNIWELSHNTKYETTNIRKCCKKQYKYAYGYKWEYERIL